MPLTLRVVGTAAAIVAGLWITASGQTRSRQAVIFDMVRLNAVVTDADGVYAVGLGADDFQILEDGVEQPIHRIQCA